MVAVHRLHASPNLRTHRKPQPATHSFIHSVDPPTNHGTLQAVPTRTLLAKSIKAFLAQTYSDEIRPVDVFKTSALEYSIDGEDPREVSCSCWCFTSRGDVGFGGGLDFS